jgi:beta-glucosidase
MGRRIVLCVAVGMLVAANPVKAQQNLSPDARADRLVRVMTLDEKIQLVHTKVGKRDPSNPPPRGPNDDIGYVAPIPRLGIPPLHIDDGSLGVANAWNARDGDEATALPSGLALAATWDPKLAFAAGALAGDEARRKGFNVLLAGSVNLVRDPHDGRAYEYAGEDPLLAGVMVGSNIRGVQSQHVVSTVKHFALNDWETGRWTLSADIAESALRESDLLAFQIAIERGEPGAVMCAYNKVNGVYACENRFLLDTVLRRDWGYRGWVMSDWGAVHGTLQSVHAGLDQESGDLYDEEVFFGRPLKQAVESGAVPMARLDAMVRAILRSLYAAQALDDREGSEPIDYAAHAATAERIAEQGIVLLKNDAALLPLRSDAESVAIIGSHADRGVLSGGGSSQVRPVGGPALIVPPAEGSPQGTPQMVWIPSPPLAAIEKEAPRARVEYADGSDIDAAAALAARSRTAIVFVHQWASEGWDVDDLSLPDDQDRLVRAVAGVNKRTVVVLETGGPVLMPWLDSVGAVIEAWFPGQRGGEAIARILFGAAEPSGRLPVTFPRDEAQLPPSAQGAAFRRGRTSVDYAEGADVGYRWYERSKALPLFPFGYGLAYTRFSYSGLRLPLHALRGAPLHASVTVRNAGERSGTELVQLYVSLPDAQGDAPQRLAAWQKVALAPGEAKTVTLTLDPHVLKRWNSPDHVWQMAPGVYRIHVGASAEDDRLSASVALR